MKRQLLTPVIKSAHATASGDMKTVTFGSTYWALEAVACCLSLYFSPEYIKINSFKWTEGYRKWTHLRQRVRNDANTSMQPYLAAAVTAALETCRRGFDSPETMIFKHLNKFLLKPRWCEHLFVQNLASLSLKINKPEIVLISIFPFSNKIIVDMTWFLEWSKYSTCT